jgi:fructose-1-phosphate kinase PfkB-like protein
MARPVTFLGGHIGDYCEMLLRREDQFEPLLTRTESATRVILTVRTQATNEQTAFFDPDPAITPPEAEGLYHRTEGAITAGGIEALTLSGSSPCATTHGLYSDLISLARAHQVPVFLDTYGPALEAIWGFWPDVIQLNRREAGLHLRSSQPTEPELWALLGRWVRRGVRMGAITDGPHPVLIQFGTERLRALPPSIEVVNPIGSGDCLLAGTVDAWLARRDPVAMIRHGLACAAANAAVWDAGAIELGTVQRLEASVMLEPAAQ